MGNQKGSRSEHLGNGMPIALVFPILTTISNFEIVGRVELNNTLKPYAAVVATSSTDVGTQAPAPREESSLVGERREEPLALVAKSCFKFTEPSDAWSSTRIVTGFVRVRL